MFKDGKISFKKKAQRDLKSDKWKVLIVDDEPEVHIITETVIKEFVFEEKTIETISAYSGKEAKELIKQNPDTAIILLDVVMEDTDSGFTFAKYVREELKNDVVRIILRTGQPGYAPAKDVIVDYDINDYKEKTELTSEKLFTTIISAIRNYKDLATIKEKNIIIEQNRVGLKQIIDSSASLFEIRSLREFAEGVLIQLQSILKLKEDALYLQLEGFTAECVDDSCNVIAGTGKFHDIAKSGYPHFDEKVTAILEKAVENKKSYFQDDVYVGYYESHTGHHNIIYLQGCENLSESDKQLINIFASNVSIAFENLYLDLEVQDTQTEVIQTLGEVVESRSKETANHVKRVSEYSAYLGRMCGLDENEVEILRHSSPLHDVGKIGISDAILLKNGKLTDDEFSVMQNHASLGAEILKHSNREILQAASIIAGEHHEKYDGTGYPEGKKGEEIHIYGRITAIADVFDALTHKRCYKEAWSFEDTVGFMKEQSGKHFDPKLIKLFFTDLEVLKNIKKIYED